MAKEEGEEGETGSGRDQKKVEEDYELILRDLEEDPEMRSTVNLYKADGTKSGKESRSRTSDAKPPNKAQNAMEVDEAMKLQRLLLS
jgi:nonsense-mediated mRNA decay protein 3